MRETPLAKKCLLKIGRLPGIRIFRNNVGMAYQGKTKFFKKPLRVLITKFRRIKFGLLVGSGDYIGWKTVIITPDMIGTKMAQFLSVEIKTEFGVRSDEQIKWCENVRKQGGIAVFVDNLDDIEI